ncbi:MAG: DNA gyrase inhibitor YacG [Verrucomicrobia bacterium]|nr:MAG: DNA gyrase inhibitor YacG [Verrucomicrobiota bacterium]
MSRKNLRELKCPTCGKIGPWWDMPHGPFCSRRCRLIDLGKWLGEEYRISQPLDPEEAEQQAADGSPAGEADPDQDA